MKSTLLSISIILFGMLPVVTASAQNSDPLKKRTDTFSQQPQLGPYSQGQLPPAVLAELKREDDAIAKANLFFVQGIGLLQKQQPDAAIAAFNKALKAYPDMSIGIQMGEAYTMKQQWQDAVKWFRKGIYPTASNETISVASYVNLEYAQVLLKTGQYGEAGTMYNVSLRNINTIDGKQAVPGLFPEWNTTGSNPYPLAALVAAALSWAEVQDVDQVKASDIAVKLATGYDLVQYYRGRALSRSGRFRDAADAYRTAHALATQSGDTDVIAAVEKEWKNYPVLADPLPEPSPSPQQ